MRLSIRSKLILYTVLPVIAVYSVLFTFGMAQVANHLSRDAQILLAEHARHQASRLGLLLSQVPTLAESLGDVIVANPEQEQSLLYAHLIDGLRRTSAARSVAVAFDSPRRSGVMQRGAPEARPLGDGETVEQRPGWHLQGDSIGFSRPIYRSGQVFGRTWILVPLADIYARLDSQRTADSSLLVRLDDGTVLDPPLDADGLTSMIADVPVPDVSTDTQTPINATLGGVDYWLFSARVPNLSWWLTAAVPVQTALAQAHRAATIFAVSLLLSLAVIVVIIGAVTRQITRPLNVLDGEVSRIASGDFNVEPRVATDDELGRLARAISRMAGVIADREKQLLASHHVLEQRVAERTAALQEANDQLTTRIRETRETQAALQLANKQAQQANRAKTEFLSNISHELRTPLHGVLGYTQMLRRETQIDETQRDSLDAIERCGQHLLTLINDILDLTRIEAGRMHIDNQTTDLVQLLADVCTIVAERARQKGLSLQQTLPPDLPRMVLTDPLKLRQILLNLLGNAVKFTHQGTVELSVSRSTEGTLRFVVSDSGEGIPEDKIEAIFDAFHQARDGQATDGTGLGLAISQRLIHLLGGDQLHAESRPGEGSRFSFCLPLRIPTGENEAEHAPGSVATPTSGTDDSTGDAGDTPAWPPRLARSMATRIYTATELGDVATLFQISEELSLNPAVAQREAEEFAAMARTFDFEGLRRFATQLQSGA